MASARGAATPRRAHPQGRSAAPCCQRTYQGGGTGAQVGGWRRRRPTSCRSSSSASERPRCVSCSPPPPPSSSSGSANLLPAVSRRRCFWKRSSAFSSAVRLSSSSDWESETAQRWALAWGGKSGTLGVTRAFQPRRGPWISEGKPSVSAVVSGEVWPQVWLQHTHAPASACSPAVPAQRAASWALPPTRAPPPKRRSMKAFALRSCLYSTSSVLLRCRPQRHEADHGE